MLVGLVRQTRLAWFRQHFYSEDELSEAERAQNAQDRAFPVSIFVMGGGGGHRTEDGRFYHGGEWRQEAEWPPPDAQTRVLFLRSAASDAVAQGSADGTLDSEQEQSEAVAPVGWVYDPEHPVPTLGGAVVGGLMGLIPPEEGGPAAEPPPRAGDQFSLWRSVSATTALSRPVLSWRLSPAFPNAQL